MRELRVADGPLEAVLLPDVGARLHRIRAFGVDLLYTPDDPRTHLGDPYSWGGYVMAPWCNRLAAEPAWVDGHLVDLPPSFADGTAIHGQVGSRPWTVDADGSTCRILAGGDGWPWRYEVALSASVAGPSLHLRLTLTNRSPDPMPAGLGMHPWWRRPIRVALPASRVYASNTSPPATAAPAAGALDLRELADPPFGLDGTWTDLDPREIELEWPDDGIGATLRLGGAADHVAVASPTGVPAVAIEAQSHAPDGLARLLRGESEGLRFLQPDESIGLGLEVTVRRT